MKSRKPDNDSNNVSRSTRPPQPVPRSKPPPVMSIPFDHLYACHLTDQTPPPASTVSQLVGETEETLSERLSRCTTEIRLLKNLLLANLDMVQHQSDRIVNREKALVALRDENVLLKSRIDRMNRRLNVPRNMLNSSSILNPASLVPLHIPPTATETSQSICGPSSSQVTLNKYTELLISDVSATTIVDPGSDKPTENCYLPAEGEYLHLPELASQDSSTSSSNHKNDFLPKDELSQFLKLSDINSLLKSSDADLSKAKNCFFTADDEFLLDVTSLDTETELGKSKDNSFDKDSAGFISIPPVTAADRLKETISRQKMSSPEVKKNAAKVARPSSCRPNTSRGTNTTKPTAKPAPKTKSPQLKIRSPIVKSKPPPVTHSQFYKSRNAPVKTTTTTNESLLAPQKAFNTSFSVNKKCKMIHTYGKSSKSKDNETVTSGIVHRRMPYTGSLSDRLKLIDTTPTGEDPYQLGEADMREQSPIPRLMLAKNHPNKTKIFTGDNFTCTSETMKLLDQSIIGEGDDGKAITKIKLNKYNYGTPYMFPGELDDEDSFDEKADMDLMGHSEVMDIVDEVAKKSAKVEASVCDFSYGENSRNLASRITFESDEYEGMFSPTYSPSNVFNQDLNFLLNSGNGGKDIKPDVAKEKEGVASRSLLKKRQPSSTIARVKKEVRAARKRTISSCSSQHSRNDPSDPTGISSKGKGKAKPLTPRGPRKRTGATSAKKTPPPAIMTRGAYHTTLGDADSNWYLGRDPDMEQDEDLPPTTSKQAVIEVPRWREKIYTSCYSMEGTENLDDEVFQKRHHKRELEEKRLKRRDLQRQREQLVVERLRRRQPDAPWYQRPSGCNEQRSPHTLIHRPRNDIHFIEIVDQLPVTAFGEIVPAIPSSDFYLPWVRSSNQLHQSTKAKEKRQAKMLKAKKA